MNLHGISEISKVANARDASSSDAFSDAPRSSLARGRAPGLPRRARGVKALTRWVAMGLALAVMLLAPVASYAARSGGSFSGRGGFRSAPSAPRGYSPSPRGGYGRGPNVVVLPGFGWGWGGGGYGMGGGSGLLGTLLLLGVFGIGAALLVRTVRRSRGSAQGAYGHDDEGFHDGQDFETDRAHVYKLQLGLGRSARGIQERLAKFAAEGDTSSETGLAALLQQTTLELLREKHSIRHALVEAAGPLTLGNAETKMNGQALAERSRYQVERVRGADGGVRRSQDAAVTGTDALEYLVVTLIVATRRPVPELTKIANHDEVDAALSVLGGMSPRDLLGIEVIWTPADPDDSLTETDLLTTYPQLRSI